jgi:hypothetical protein
LLSLFSGERIKKNAARPCLRRGFSFGCRRNDRQIAGFVLSGRLRVTRCGPVPHIRPLQRAPARGVAALLPQTKSLWRLFACYAGMISDAGATAMGATYRPTAIGFVSAFSRLPVHPANMKTNNSAMILIRVIPILVQSSLRAPAIRKRPPGRDTERPLARLPAPGLLRFRRYCSNRTTVILHSQKNFARFPKIGI